MLSGERRTSKASGNPARRKIMPAPNAADLQPQIWIAHASSGVSKKPPRLTEALIIDIAMVRMRINQVLAISMGASMKPA
jgi:hypothetical protein